MNVIGMTFMVLIFKTSLPWSYVANLLFFVDISLKFLCFSFFFNQIEEKFTKHLLRAPVTFVEDDTSIHQILYQVIKRIL